MGSSEAHALLTASSANLFHLRWVLTAVGAGYVGGILLERLSGVPLVPLRLQNPASVLPAAASLLGLKAVFLCAGQFLPASLRKFDVEGLLLRPVAQAYALGKGVDAASTFAESLAAYVATRRMDNVLRGLSSASHQPLLPVALQIPFAMGCFWSIGAVRRLLPPILAPSSRASHVILRFAIGSSCILAAQLLSNFVTGHELSLLRPLAAVMSPLSESGRLLWQRHYLTNCFALGALVGAASAVPPSETSGSGALMSQIKGYGASLMMLTGLLCVVSLISILKLE